MLHRGYSFLYSLFLAHIYIYLFLTAIGLTPGGSSTVHIYTQTVHRIQQYSTHLHTNSTQNTENGTYVTIKKIIGKCGLCPVFASYTMAFPLQLSEKPGKPSVMVVEKCPDVPVAVVQYTFTHKPYTEQHNETEYTEHKIQNSKNASANKITCYAIIKNT
jgi:hypothetical protein